MPTHETSLRRAAAALLLGSLVLTGCSSPEPKDDTPGGKDYTGSKPAAATYDFSNPMQGPSTEITVEIGESLAKAIGPKVDQLPVKKFKLTPYKLDTAQYCAATIEFDWTDPQLIEKYKKPRANQADVDKAVKDGVDELLKVYEVSTPEEWVTNRRAAETHRFTLGEQYVNYFSDAVKEAAKKRTGTNPIDPQDVLDAFKAKLKDVATQRLSEKQSVNPESNLIHELLGPPTAQPLSALDKANPDTSKGPYFVAPDGKSAVVVRRCATHAMSDDGSATEKLDFQTSASDRELASVTYVIMADGTVSITQSEAPGFKRDANGTWVGA